MRYLILALALSTPAQALTLRDLNRRHPTLPDPPPTQATAPEVEPYSSVLCPDGTYITRGVCVLCPNGKYVANKCHRQPGGYYTGE